MEAEKNSGLGSHSLSKQFMSTERLTERLTEREPRKIYFLIDPLQFKRVYFLIHTFVKLSSFVSTAESHLGMLIGTV